ncbi:hypothetical protein O6P43_026971, partial [Quillaja saponaria]
FSGSAYTTVFGCMLITQVKLRQGKMTDATDHTSALENENQGQCIIDIPERNNDDICIYRVPPHLHQVNNKAYTPQLISIGPFHHGKHEFKAMEVHKRRYHQEFQKRNLKKTVLEFREYIEKTEGDIRKCYAEKSMLSSVDFVDMIELDAVFIMEFLLRSRKAEKNLHNHEYKDDYVLSKPWLKNNIELDLILLENQIPFFILTELYTFVDVRYQMTEENGEEMEGGYCPYFVGKEFSCENCFTSHVHKGEKHGKDDVTEDMAAVAGGFLGLACDYFEHYHPNKKAKHIRVEEKEVRHFTDLIRRFYIPYDLVSSGSTTFLDDDILYSATKLQEAGVTFKAVSDRCLLDIKFKKEKYLYYLPCLSFLPFKKFVKARLELPKLTVEGKTERVLRNLIALEQCHYPYHQYICNYIALIDDLIYSNNDVDLLLQENVIVNRLGNHAAVTEMINSLAKEIVISSTCYEKLIKKLNAHHNVIWNRRMAILRSVYFRDLWRTSSTIVGLAVLAFTFISFFRSMD